MGINQFLSVLWARKWVAFFVFALTVGTTVAVSLMLPKKYTATAELVIELKSDPLGGAIFANMASASYMATQVDILLSERVARRVVSNLRLNENEQIRQQWLEATQGQSPIESWLATSLRDSLNVLPSRESSLIHVSYTSPDPRFAAALANAFVQGYLDTTLDLRVDPARQYSSFFDSRAKELREGLEQAQARVSSFQREKGIIASDERLDIETARLQELSSQLVALQSITAESSSRQALARGDSADQLPEVLTSGLVSGLRGDVTRAEARLQELNSRLGDNHPQVIEARASIAELRSRMQAESRRVSGGASVANTINRQREAEIRGSLEAQRVKVLRMKSLRDDGAVLIKDVENAQRAYDQVLARRNQTSLESQTTQTNAQPLAQATIPVSPSAPKIALNTTLSIVVGALLRRRRCAVARVPGPACAWCQRSDRRSRPADARRGAEAGTTAAPVRSSAGHAAAAAHPRAVAQSQSQSRRLMAKFRDSMPASPEMLGLAPTPAASPADQGLVHDRSIGDMLRDARDLSDDQVERILQYQREHGVRFGEAAVKLGLVSADDVLHALSQQFHYPYAPEERRHLSPELVSLNQPFSHQAEAFRAIRSQIMMRVLADGTPRRALAVVSPNTGDGKTFFAANLAVALAQLGGRTLLVDADLRGPRQHAVFGMENVAGLSSILSGRAESQVIQPVPGVSSLFVLPVGITPPNPLELVERPAFALLMRELTSKFDHVIVDTPAAIYGADAFVVAARCGAALVIARKNASRLGALQDMVAMLSESPAKLGGVILNEY